MELRDFGVQGFLRDRFKTAELIKIVNPKQCYFYMTQGIYPLWNECGYDDKIVYVFLKEPTLRLFKQWREHNTDWGK